MRNGCLEHFPGWNDADQALSFVTLIAHLSGSWREARRFFSNRGFGLPCMCFRGLVRWVSVSPLFGTGSSACIVGLWAEKTQHTPVLWRPSTTSQTGLCGEPPEMACRSPYQHPLGFHPEKLAYVLVDGQCEPCTTMVSPSVWGRQRSNSQPKIVTIQALGCESLCSHLPLSFIILLA